VEFHIAQQLYTSVDSTLQSTLAANTAKVMLGVTALIGTFWLLQFTIKSIFWLFQGMTVAFREIVVEIAKVAVIAGLAFNLTWYIQTIVPFVTGFPPWIGGLLSGQEGDQINQIDSLIGTYADSLVKLIKAMSFNIFTTGFSKVYLGIQAVIIYLIAGIPFILVAVGSMLTLKVMTTVFLVLGPLFIAFALFDKTRQWFWGWVAILAGFMLTQILFSVVMGLELAFINTVVIKNGAIDTSLQGNISMLVYFACFTVLATELPGYAATVMGGAPVSTNGIGGMLSKGTGVNAAVKGYSGAKNLISKFTGTGSNNIK
jgi:type IV secretion system protein VirB6